MVNSLLNEQSSIRSPFYRKDCDQSYQSLRGRGPQGLRSCLVTGMSDFLVYWKRFWVETGGNLADIGNYWRTASKAFTKVTPGDRVWVVINGGKNNPAAWKLLQLIVVSEKR